MESRNPIRRLLQYFKRKTVATYTNLDILLEKLKNIFTHRLVYRLGKKERLTVTPKFLAKASVMMMFPSTEIARKKRSRGQKLTI